MIDAIFQFEFADAVAVRFPLLLYLGVVGILLGFYTLFRRDLPMLALGSISVLVVLVTWIGWQLWRVFELTDGFLAESYFCFMGSITIGLTAALAFGLRRLQLAWEIEE